MGRSTSQVSKTVVNECPGQAILLNPVLYHSMCRAAAVAWEYMYLARDLP